MRVSLTGDAIAALLSVSAEHPGAFKSDRSYDLARIHLLRVGCPRELAAVKENRQNRPLVIEKNRKHFGEIQTTGYYPQAVLVAGAYRRDQLVARGLLDAFAWVERGSIELQSGDAIHCGDLVRDLTEQLQHKLYGDRPLVKGQPWPLLCCVHPFEGEALFDLGGKRYRHAYSLDAEGNVVLAGEVTACARTSPDGGHFTDYPLPLAGNQVRMWGAANSDIMRMLVLTSPSVASAVANLVTAIHHGLYKPMKPSFAPVNLSDDGKILGPLVEAGISPADYVIWADEQGGEFLAHEFSDQQRKKLAKTGAAQKDGSFPIQNRSDLANAVKAFGRAKNPTATKAHIIRHARKLGAMDVLPDDWKADVKAWGAYHHGKVGGGKKSTFGMHPHSGMKRGVGSPKKESFHV